MFSHLLPVTALLLFNYQGQREALYDAQLTECWMCAKTTVLAVCLRKKNAKH